MIFSYIVVYMTSEQQLWKARVVGWSLIPVVLLAIFHFLPKKLVGLFVPGNGGKGYQQIKIILEKLREIFHNDTKKKSANTQVYVSNVRTRHFSQAGSQTLSIAANQKLHLNYSSHPSQWMNCYNSITEGASLSPLTRGSRAAEDPPHAQLQSAQIRSNKSLSSNLLNYL